MLKKRIKLEIPPLEVLELTGSTRERSKPVDRFETSKPCVMLASLKAAGLGVTLKSADYVFLMDPWWNPAVEEQAIDRAHRLGREKTNFYLPNDRSGNYRRAFDNYNFKERNFQAGYWRARKTKRIG